ncbi:flagellar biosynthesis protein FlhA [Vibrio sp. D431a]|uniref:flagellar biosynthesis protein FlhA n=1 Tax=Vibrio sp. D431a TaxID=2837388 RepID=UPI002553E20C|nr:flagellar biosynthesis protein FlhA [Vibrio sp. D431a]MDK9793919.1 flagellar type III secretion system protein FlhA [Vibrio sp. D431a]
MNSFLDRAKNSAAAPIFLLVVIAMFVIPLPPLVLDTLFIVNIVIAVTILMTCINAKKPLDFSVFPTVLLLATILRLSLNVASTRVILMHGAEGSGGAGQVIEAFGEFVIGGNFVVGIVVFTIITIINFIVITKGAERISEVGARFSLDSMPGKQMAVDADLGSGTISHEEAAERRRDIGLESQFYGNLDGTSKAVKGDAIAGILILLVNIIGGLIVGMSDHEMSFPEALSAFTIMSIGDGLVAIIPSIIMALATAIIVSRVNGEVELSDMIGSQVCTNPIVPAFAGAIVVAMALIPAMPTVLLLAIAGALFFFSYTLYKKEGVRAAEEAKAAEEIEKGNTPEKEEDTSEVNIKDISEREIVRIEIGCSLAELAKSETSPLTTAIKGLRKQISKEFGILVKGFLITDSIDLEPNEYRIVVEGLERGRAVVFSQLLMALDHSNEKERLKPLPRGSFAIEPVYGYGGYWIMNDDRTMAEEQGYTIIEPSVMITAHIQEVILKNLHLMIDIDDLQTIVDKVAVFKPKLVEVAVPDSMRLTQLLNITKGLLQERISISQISVIMETMNELAGVAIPFPVLLKHVRNRLAPWILSGIQGLKPSEPVKVIIFSDGLNELLRAGLQEDGTILLNQNTLRDITERLRNAEKQLNDFSYPAILLTDDNLRRGVYDLFGTQIPRLHILDSDGITKDCNVELGLTIGD